MPLATAQAFPTSNSNALAVAAAMGTAEEPSLITAATWPTLPGGAANPSAPEAVGVGTGRSGMFMPDNGISFAVLTTGEVDVSDPNNDLTDDGSVNGTHSRNVDDLSILKVDIDVPGGDNCLAFDAVFYAQDYADATAFPGTNDGFLAELDTDDWTVDPTTGLDAPHNFAVDGGGRALTVRNPNVRRDPRTNLEYDADSGLLTAATPVTPGNHSVYFSIYDTGGAEFDSAAFIDNLHTYQVNPGQCVSGIADADTDGDGISNDWETRGIRDASGNMLVDLPAMGADPNHKDIFVQLDAMTPNALDTSALLWIQRAFFEAPVANPDGTTGINLHVDEGPNSMMDWNLNRTWGSLSEANLNVPPQFILGSFDAAGFYDWSAFDAIKHANFSPARAMVFHYALAAEFIGSNPTPAGGLARDIPSSDFIVGQVNLCDPPGSCAGAFDVQAATFMHELGHNLGLAHGGQVNETYEPNYISLMNYNYAPFGLSADLETAFDFSRYDSSVIPDLNENDLDESAGFGLGANPPQGLTTRYAKIWCDQGLVGTRIVVNLVGPIDFNCDGDTNDVHVRADLNDSGHLTTLRSYDDWSSLVFRGGAIGGADLTPLLPELTSVDEPDPRVVQEEGDRLIPPPTVTTGAAQGVGAHSATLVGSGNPKGEDATLTFQYGTSSSYGSTAPGVDLGSGSTVMPVTAGLPGLGEGTTYHYRAVVTTIHHIEYGDDVMFTTGIGPIESGGGGTSGGGTTSAAPAPAVTVLSSANPAADGTPVTYTASLSPAPACGSVSWLIDNVAAPGAAPTGGSNGTYTLGPVTLTQGTHTVTAVFSGCASAGAASGSLIEQVSGVAVTPTSSPTVSASPTPSSPPVAVTPPTVRAHFGAPAPKSAAGWYHTAVAVWFTCTAGSSPLANACPAPTILTTSGGRQVVTATVSDTDGGTKTVRVTGIKIDLDAPTLIVAAPRHECVARDALSGVASCVIHRQRHTRHGVTTVSWTAVATDNAGNTTTERGTYRQR